MKKIVKGNDFTLRIPVMKMVEGQAQAFPLPACTDVVVQVCNQFKRIPLAYEIDVKEDNMLLARIDGDKISLGTYAIEVKGKIFGNDWRSNEYPQFAIVANNADADTEFGATDEGDNSVEMDTAMVILPPTVELSDLVNKANDALKNNKETNDILNANESARKEAETQRANAETERTNAEHSRASAEDARMKAEVIRVNSEAQRVDAEEQRVSAENEREFAENGRASAEAERVQDEKKRQAESAKAVKAANDAAAQANATNESIKTNEQGRVDAEMNRKSAENSRNDKEGIRQESENERISQETQRQTNEQKRVEAENKRINAEGDRVSAEGARAEAEQARVDAETKRECDFDTAIQEAENATLGAERVNAELEGNVLTVTNRNGEQKSVNLTDTDEHVTVNCTTTMEDVSMEGLVINVYINNGEDPHQYTTDTNGQAEFTITKGATYKIVFPYVQKCNIIDPVQHVASVGNRIIDANYIAETEKMERLTIKMSKADESGNITPWEGGKAYVTIAGKKTEYIMDADGRAVVDIKNGTSYTVSVDKIDGMYEQYDRYSITRTAIADSYRFNFIYRPYESGIWLIDDNNKQWTYDDWEASGNDNSKLMFVRIATLATQRYKGDILISIDKMADFSKVAVTKQWCDQSVEFKNIPLDGRNTNHSNWSRFAYNGLLATQTIIAEGDERGLTTAAADYCYSSTIANGDKLYQGYLPTVYQWELTWQNMDIVIDAINKKYPDLNVNKTTFSGNKWTSTQNYANYSYYFTMAGGVSKNSSCLAFPFYACLSDSPSLLSLPDEQDESSAQAA
nr:MAG TPA: MAEBL protein [Caudoviricetes sp.]